MPRDVGWDSTQPGTPADDRRTASQLAGMCLWLRTTGKTATNPDLMVKLHAFPLPYTTLSCPTVACSTVAGSSGSQPQYPDPSFLEPPPFPQFPGKCDGFFRHLLRFICLYSFFVLFAESSMLEGFH